MQKDSTDIKRKIKLLFITYTHSNGGGAEKLLTDYVNSLTQEGFEISICEISHFDVKKESINTTVKVIKPLLFHNKHFIYNFFFGFFNLKMLEKNPKILKSVFHWTNYDVVITWNYQRPSFALMAFQEEGKIAWFHGDIYDLCINNKSSKKLLEYNRKQLEVWKKADCIITISKNSKKSLEEVFPELGYKCEIINNGVDTEKILCLAAEKNDFIFDKEVKYLCCVGRLDYNKNFILAIKSLKLILQKYQKCKLIIIGDGDQRSALEEYVTKNNLKENVIFVGYQKNPYRYMKNCYLLCMTSFSEGWSLVTAEMMVLGKTFVTTKVAGASDELALNNTCGLVAEWNELDFAEKILKLLKDESLYRELCHNSLENIKKYTISKSVEKISKIINRVLPSVHNNYKKNYFQYIIFNTFIPAIQKDWLKKRYTGVKCTLLLIIYSIIYYLCWGITIPFRFLLSIIYCYY